MKLKIRLISLELLTESVTCREHDDLRVVLHDSYHCARGQHQALQAKIVTKSAKIELKAQKKQR